MNPTENIRRYQLQQGINKKGETYDRKIEFPPGMAELVNIVAGLQKDVKRINKAFTLEGAKEYAKKKGRNWTAHEEDITGPNGKPDGIKEVFVTDGKGNVKVINGYGLGKTSYPLKKLYMNGYPTRAAREGYSYSRFLQDFHDVSPEIDTQGNYRYGYNLDEIPNMTPQLIAQYQNLRKEITPREFFKQIIFGMIYRDSKDDLKAQFSPMEMAQIYNISLSKAYNQLVRDPVLQNHFHINPALTKKSKIEKICKSDEFKQMARALINTTSTNEDEAARWSQEIDTIMGIVAGDIDDNRPHIQIAEDPEDANDY